MMPGINSKTALSIIIAKVGNTNNDNAHPSARVMIAPKNPTQQPRNDAILKRLKNKQMLIIKMFL